MKLPPIGGLSGRFDLPDESCAYLGESPDTALYESLFRREKEWVTLDELRARELVTVSVRSTLELGDLRPHAAGWPVLQALRFSETQELAREAREAGFDGFIYRSAQHYGQDSVVLFEPAPSCLILRKRLALINARDQLNRWVLLAAQHSKVPVVA